MLNLYTITLSLITAVYVCKVKQTEALSFYEVENYLNSNVEVLKHLNNATVSNLFKLDTQNRVYSGRNILSVSKTIKIASLEFKEGTKNYWALVTIDAVKQTTIDTITRLKGCTDCKWLFSSELISLSENFDKYEITYFDTTNQSNIVHPAYATIIKRQIVTVESNGKFSLKP